MLQVLGWLKRAVDAGYKNAADINENADLNTLRDRNDFKTLLAELQNHIEKAKGTSPPSTTSRAQ